MSTTRSHAPSTPNQGARPSTPQRTGAAHRRGTALAIAALVVVLGTLFFLQVRHFFPFITDDAFISLRYSERLLQGKGLTWNDMHPVEGYTNLLWVLACAGLGGLGLSLPFAAQFLGIVCTVFGIAAVAAQAFRDYPIKIRFLAALFGCGALVLSGPVDVWAQGGLEQPMLAALLAWAAYFGMRWVSTSKPNPRDTTIMGVLLGLACLTRADAALFTAAFFLGGVLADGPRVRTVLSRARLLPIPILLCVGQLLFRRFYYHDWLPNTAYVKVAFTLHRLYTGLRYDLVGFKIEAFFCLLALIGAAALWKAGKQRQVKFLVTIVVVWLVYLVVIGGDIFTAVRHFVPALAVAAFLICGCGLLTLGAPFRFSRGRVIVFLILTGLVVTSDYYCRQETWERQGKSIGLFLKQAFGDKRPLLSSDAAGVVPFYSQLPAIDPLGLNDYHISRMKSKLRGEGWLGHELADGKYVMDQKPDLLIFSNFHSDIYFPSDTEIMQDPRFKTSYQKVSFDTDPPDATRASMYVRRLNGPLAIQESTNRITVPAYLATTNDANSVKLVDGHAQLVLPPGGRATFKDVPVTEGPWQFDVHSKDAANLAVSENNPISAGSESFTVLNHSAAPMPVESIDLVHK